MADDAIDLSSPDAGQIGPCTLLVTLRAKLGQTEMLDRELVTLAIRST